MKAPYPEELHDYTFCLPDLLLVSTVPNMPIPVAARSRA
jgi:hypothetical protein